MTNLIEHYLVEVDGKLTVEPTQRMQVLSELRNHLWEKVADLKAAQTSLPDEEVQRRVIREFGTPDDLALAYNPEGSVVLTDSQGATIMTFSAAVTKASKAVGKAAGQGAKAVGRGASLLGRGAGRAMKVAFLGFIILLATALLSGTLVAIFLYDDIRDTIYDHAPEDVYEQSVHCTRAVCDGVVGADGFYVSSGVNRLSFAVNVGAPEGAVNGTAHLRIVDPAGTAVFDKTFPNPGGRLDESGHWAPIEGTWTVELTFDGYGGWVELDVWARGIAR